LQTTAAAFTLSSYYHYAAVQSTIGSTSAVTSQYGYFVDSTMTGATNNYGFYSAIASGSSNYNLYMNGTAPNYMAGALGIGSNLLTGFNLRASKNITGATSAYGVIQDGTVQSDVTSDAIGYRNNLNTAASAFTLTNYWHFWARQSSIGAGSTVTNQQGFYVDSNMTGGTTANYGFRGAIPASGSINWNLYMDGTAPNYMAGSLGIGTTSLTGITLAIGKNITGAVTSYGAFQTGLVLSDVTTSARYYATSASTTATTFTLTDLIHYYSAQGTFGTGSTVTNQYGFFAQSSLTGATNNYGFYSAIASGTNRWNLYMAGTATNFLQGELQLGSGQVVSASVINTVTNKVKLIINGTTYYLLASTSGT
jgi:hypothetical protein